MSRFILFLSAAMLCSSFASAAENWSKEHPNANAALRKILDKNPEFRADFASFTKANPQRAKHFFHYLTTKEGRTIQSYQESQDQKNEAFRHLMALKKKYPVRMVRVREWAQNHPKPARHLFEQDDAAHYLLGTHGKHDEKAHGHDHDKHKEKKEDDEKGKKKGKKKKKD